MAISLETLMENLNKSKTHHEMVKRLGTSVKSSEFQEAICKCNKLFDTSFYVERDGHSFIVQGHREFGHMSRRNGTIGIDIDLTLGLHEIERAGRDDTIKMIVDNSGNFIIISLQKLRDCNEFDNRMLQNRFMMKNDNTIPYYHWSLGELNDLGAILYSNIKFSITEESCDQN